MNLRKHVILALSMVSAVAVFTGCGTKDAKDEPITSTEPTSEAVSQEPSQEVAENEAPEASQEVIYVTEQLADPEKGETIATLKIKDYGDIKVKFFPKDAPKAVENFVTHAKDGYYDGVTFHRVIDDFMIQGGDPLGNGMGGESIWGDEFEDEISPDLIPLRGALCMANAGGGNTNGSQFFIVQSSEIMDGDLQTALQSFLDQAKQTTGCPLESYHDIVLENYKKVGGCLFLSGGYTVFGQVIEGLEIVDQIAKVEKDSMDKPYEDVVIETIEISEY